MFLMIRFENWMIRKESEASFILLYKAGFLNILFVSIYNYQTNLSLLFIRRSCSILHCEVTGVALTIFFAFLTACRAEQEQRTIFGAHFFGFKFLKWWSSQLKYVFMKKRWTSVGVNCEIENLFWVDCSDCGICDFE